MSIRTSRNPTQPAHHCFECPFPRKPFLVAGFLIMLTSCSGIRMEMKFEWDGWTRQRMERTKSPLPFEEHVREDRSGFNTFILK